MGGAIAKALAKKGQRVFVYDKSYAKAKAFSKNGKIIADKNFENLTKANIIIVAVKPQNVPELSLEIKDRFKPSTIVISIAAGLQLKKLSGLFRHKKMVRVMPSLALTVGQGVAFWKAANAVSSSERKAIGRLLQNFTEHFQVKDEKLVDAGSIIYGSGPAYFFLLASHLEKAALKLGINEEQSHKLVEKTFLGAAMLQKNEDYLELISRIASKKGITEEALKVFKKYQLEKIVNQAVIAGFKRTKELNRG